MNIFLLGVVVASAASVGVAVLALFVAIRHARRERAAAAHMPETAATSVPRHSAICAIEDTVPWMQSRQPEWDSR
jgi:hypothetical protein